MLQMNAVRRLEGIEFVSLHWQEDSGLLLVGEWAAFHCPATLRLA